MYRYKSEFLELEYKLFSIGADRGELSALDELLSRRSQDGWELATYTFEGAPGRAGWGILVTFRQEIT